MPHASPSSAWRAEGATLLAVALHLRYLDTTQEAEIVHSLLGVKGESDAHSFMSSQILPAT
jgi:hypothetical protein